jgi:hypothetical protein
MKKDLASYDDILNYRQPKFSEMFESDANRVYDRFTNADWHFINEKCHLVPDEEMIRINPVSKDCDFVPLVFSGYAKPGKHIVMVYDHKLDSLTYTIALTTKRHALLPMEDLKTGAKMKSVPINPDIDVDEID